MRFVIQGSFLAAALAQQVALNPIEDFCRRHGHQTCMIGNELYIDGGMIYMSGGSDSWTNDSIAIPSKSLPMLRLPVSTDSYRYLDDQGKHLGYG